MSKMEILDNVEEEGMIVLEIQDGYSVGLVEIPIDEDIDTFFNTTDVLDISKSKNDKHYGYFSPSERFDKFRVGNKDDDGKDFNVVYGRVTGTNKWSFAKNIYNPSIWDQKDAREHCKKSGAIAFDHAGVEEAAVVAERIFPITENQEYHIKKKDSDRQLVYGIVLEPNVVDMQGDYESEATIEAAAHKFLLKLWMEKQRPMIGSEHERPLPTAIPVESYIAKADQYFPGCPETEEYFVSKGSWILVSLIADEEEFSKIKRGVYKGYSIQGDGKRRPVSE